MSPTTIENPILNSPFAEPVRHFRFGEDGITDEIVEVRRPSSYFIPIAKPRTRGKAGPAQLALETEWIAERVQENKLINDVRARVDLWRRGGYVGVTKTTRRLLEYWSDPGRSRSDDNDIERARLGRPVSSSYSTHPSISHRAILGPPRWPRGGTVLQHALSPRRARRRRYRLPIGA